MDFNGDGKYDWQDDMFFLNMMDTNSNTFGKSSNNNKNLTTQNSTFGALIFGTVVIGLAIFFSYVLYFQYMQMLSAI